MHRRDPRPGVRRTNRSERGHDVRIAVVGGTGFVGARLVEELKAVGHEVCAHAKNTGLDLLTRQGLPGAADGAEVVVNTIGAPSFDAAATPFFRFLPHHDAEPVDAAEGAGVEHLVLLSIVGTDRAPRVDCR